MFKSSFIVMTINMLSRILGLVREMIIGSLFGASGLTDAYFAAAKFSNLFTSLFGEGSLGTVVIPLYNEKSKKEGVDAANDLIFSVMNLAIAFISTVSILMIVFSRPIIRIFGGLKDPARLDIASNLLKIMAFYLMFIALSGIVASVLNNYKKFMISASTALVFNITIITGTLLLNKPFGIYGVGIAFLLSGIFQFMMQLPQFIIIVKRYKFIFNFKDKYVKDIFLLMTPTLIGIFGFQINEFVSLNFAGLLGNGVISAMNYASRLYLLPIGVFAISLSVVIFPSMSRAIVNEKWGELKTLITRGLNLLAFLIIPSIVILFGYAKEIVTLIYKHGQFTSESVLLTSQALQFYSLGLLFFSSIHLLTRSHYVYKDRKLPVISSFTSIFINLLLNFLLYKQYKHIGLTASTSIAALVNYIILLVSLKKRYIDINVIKYVKFVTTAILTSLAAFYTSALVNVSRAGVFEVIIKVMVFAIVYLLLWSYTYYKKRINMFN